MQYRIALCGFSEFEYRAMHFSFEHPASPEETRYEVVDALADADFAVVDADSRPAVKGVVMSNRVAHAVFVGAAAPPGGNLHVPRPIDPTRIRRLLDALSLRYPLQKPRLDAPAKLDLPTLDDIVPLDDPADVTQPAAMITPFRFADPAPPEPREPLARPAPHLELPIPAPAPAPPPAPADVPVQVAHAAPAVPAPAQELAVHNAAKAKARAAARRARLASQGTPLEAESLLRDVLVLDADDATGAQLCELLERFGFSAHRVRSISGATEQLGARAYAAIFLDIALDDGAGRGEGVALLQRIQELPLAEGQRAPAVLMVSAHLNPADRVRAALAGIKVPLVKPVSRGDVARALEGCGVSLPADARRR